MAQGQNWQNVEQVEGPFEGNEDERVAYVMVYTAHNDTVISVAKDKGGATVATLDDDFREKTRAGDHPDVGWAAKAARDKEAKAKKDQDKEQDKHPEPAHAPQSAVKK